MMAVIHAIAFTGLALWLNSVAEKCVARRYNGYAAIFCILSIGALTAAFGCMTSD